MRRRDAGQYEAALGMLRSLVELGLGHAAASRLLGEMYLDGQGVAADEAKAVEHIRCKPPPVSLDTELGCNPGSDESRRPNWNPSGSLRAPSAGPVQPRGMMDTTRRGPSAIQIAVFLTGSFSRRFASPRATLA